MCCLLLGWRRYALRERGSELRGRVWSLSVRDIDRKENWNKNENRWSVSFGNPASNKHSHNTGSM